MLTWEELEAIVVQKRLVRWTCGSAHPPEGGRALYMTPDVFAGVSAREWPASLGETVTRTRDRRSAMRQVLERFVKGHALVPRKDVKELGSENIQPSMKGYWSIRSQGPIEQTRILGFFARPGAFVATAFKPRSSLTEQWQAQKRLCEIEWGILFPGAKCLGKPWPVLMRSEYEEYTNDHAI